MDTDLQKRVSIAINTFFPQMIDDYLDDHQMTIKANLENKSIPSDILNLIVTLKYWANPDSSFQPQLAPEELINFKYVIEILQNPEKILSQEGNFSTQDKTEIKLAVQAKLDQIANQLIDQYKLSNEVEKNIHTTENEIAKWWKSKSVKEQERIKAKYENLGATEKKQLQEVVQNKSTVVVINDPTPDLFWLYWMSHYQWHSHWHHHRCGLHFPFSIPIYTSSIHVPSFGGYTSSISNGGYSSSLGGGSSGNSNGGYSSSGGGGGKIDGDAVGALGIIAAAVAGIAIICAGIVGEVYALKKALNSTINVFTGNKVARSLFRLTGILGGEAAGVYGGMLVGAALGSIIPGVGNVAGAIIGGLAGGGIGAAIGALTTKYIAKGISALHYSDHLNPTNPEKYSLSKKQKKHLLAKGFSIDGVELMIAAIHREKSKIGISGSFFWTEARAKKTELNNLLQTLKNHPEKLKYPLKIGSLDYDPSPSRFDFQKENINNLSSTAQYMAPAFGANLAPQYEPQTIAPNAPPMEPEDELTVTLENENGYHKKFGYGT